MADPKAKAIASATPSSVPSGNVADFDSDLRMFISKESGKWRFEQDDGPELEYDDKRGAWFPVQDDSLLQAQASAYAIPGVNETIESAKERKAKRKKATSSKDDGEPNFENEPSSDSNKRQKINTGVYITGLPKDVTSQELVDVFSKCGVILDDFMTDAPKVKIYTNDDSTPRGDGLVVYLRNESVQLAIDMLDDTEFRYGMTEKMKVSKADYSQKSDDKKSETGKNGSSSSRPPLDKDKVKRKLQKMKAKLEGWSDEDDDFVIDTTHNITSTATTNPKFAKVVILKYMFTLAQIESDPTFILDLASDVREECELLGQVTNVTIYDKEEDGVVSVRFGDEVAARACVFKMDGRFFDGQKVQAGLWDGKRYKKSGKGDDQDESERLDSFGKWLEEEKAADEAANMAPS